MKALLPKMKLLIVICLLGAFLGGALGVFTKMNDHSYGTNIEFYVSPKPDEDSKKNDSQFGVYGAYGWHVMDNITKLLSSESFAEQLLLGDDKLPITMALPDLKTEEGMAFRDMNEAIRVPNDEYAAAQKAKEEALEVYEEKQKELNKIKTEASKADLIYRTLLQSTLAEPDAIEEARQNMETAELKLEGAELALESAEMDVEDAKQNAQDKLEASEESYERIYELWRETDVYKETIKLMQESVKFSFYNEKDFQVSTSTETLAKSFIYVSINVSESLDLANFVYKRVIAVLPKYVQENMAVPSGYTGTNCQRISRLDEVREANIGAFAFTAAAYAMICGVLAFCAAAAIIVVSDRAGKWYQLNKGELAMASKKKPKKKARVVEEFDENAEE